MWSVAHGCRAFFVRPMDMNQSILHRPQHILFKSFPLLWRYLRRVHRHVESFPSPIRIQIFFLWVLVIGGTPVAYKIGVCDANTIIQRCWLYKKIFLISNTFKYKKILILSLNFIFPTAVNDPFFENSIQYDLLHLLTAHLCELGAGGLCERVLTFDYNSMEYNTITFGTQFNGIQIYFKTIQCNTTTPDYLIMVKSSSVKFDAKLWNVLKLLFQNISQNII